MLMVWSQSQLDQGARVRNHLALPAVIGLEALHRRLGFGVPNAGGGAIHVMLANQPFLNFTGARGIDLLLAALACHPLVRFLGFAERGMGTRGAGSRTTGGHGRAWTLR